jgi:hypothetical protein
VFHSKYFLKRKGRVRTVTCELFPIQQNFTRGEERVRGTNRFGFYKVRYLGSELG